MDGAVTAERIRTEFKKEITKRDVEAFIEHEQDRGIMITTIRTKLVCVRAFFRYLVEEEIVLPDVLGKRIRLQLPDRLPRAMDPDDLRQLLSVIDHTRDRAVFMLMIRCGLRVEEVANVSLDALDFKQRKILIKDGNGSKDRIVYMSNDVIQALTDYLKARPSAGAKRVFLVMKGPSTGHPISIRGIQKRMEYYACKGKLHISCHSLRHNAEFRIMPSDFRMWGYPWFYSISCSA
ncbi:MAG: tyrosine-type recombinase/integrase [Pseudomonadota bacterium]